MEAEANVGGILRGGKLIDGVFIFHAGTLEIETTHYTDLRIWDGEKWEKQHD